MNAPQQTAAGSPTDSAPDPRPLFAHALDQTQSLIDSVTPSDLGLPTPCADWSVRELLGHLVAVARRVTHIAHGGHPFEVTSLVTEVPGDDWAGAFRESRAQLDAALAEDGVLDRTFAHPAGQFPARQAIFAYFNELATHDWDLARAIDSTDALDPALAEATLEPIRSFLPATPRGGQIPFGPVIEVPDDAPAYDRLLGWLGRDPGWKAGAAG